MVNSPSFLKNKSIPPSGPAPGFSDTEYPCLRYASPTNSSKACQPRFRIESIDSCLSNSFRFRHELIADTGAGINKTSATKGAALEAAPAKPVQTKFDGLASNSVT